MYRGIALTIIYEELSCTIYRKIFMRMSGAAARTGNLEGKRHKK